MNAERAALVVVVASFRDVEHVAQHDDLVLVEKSLRHAGDDLSAARGDEIFEPFVAHSNVGILGAFDHEAHVAKERVLNGDRARATRTAVRIDVGVVAFDFVGQLVDEPTVLETIVDPTKRDAKAMVRDGFDQFHRQWRTQRLGLIVGDEMCRPRVDRGRLRSASGELFQEFLHRFLRTTRDADAPRTTTSLPVDGFPGRSQQGQWLHCDRPR